ncbi:MAG: ECF transporter S component [Clostridia bacterium]|nr:ECF transporter S component [Clostridia bacterium]
MNRTEQRKLTTRRLVLGAVFTAFVIVLQSLATFTTFFGPFSTAVGLIPIVLGAAMCGTGVGAWLGFVFGVVVLATGNAALFFAFDVPGTVVTVLLKGTACGIAAGLTYKLLAKINRYVAVIGAAIICPITNTAVFLLGCYAFFMDSATAIATTVGLSVGGMAVFWALAMGNFIIEVVTNAVLSPIVFRVLNIKKF